MTHDLFAGKYSPITNSIGFLKCSLPDAVHAFSEWQSGIQSKRGVQLVERKVGGDLEEAIQALLPLTSVERRRYLFIPTNSEWVAFLDNGRAGTDVFAHLSFLAKQLSTNAARAALVPEKRPKQFPCVIFELYGPHQTDFLNYIRSISVSYDGKKWEFSEAGAVQPFEETAAYAESKIQNRFTSDMLSRYLSAIGIHAFDPQFYLPDGDEAVLFEKIGPIAPAAREFQLSDL